MNYQEALNFVLSFADYERWPGFGYASRFDLRRMYELLQKLGSPHLGRRTVHIAGSKGKGSTAAMIASVLTSAGFRTGLYTSPHLHTMRERIRIGHELISEQELADLVSEIRPAVEETHNGQYGELSTFEILTALAFYYFHKQGADFQVLETGLGGRLDATNVARAEICVITSISLDHTAFLGDTTPQIAREKAGIIKSLSTVVSSPQVLKATEVIRTVCSEKKAKIVIIGEDVNWHGNGLCPGGQSLKVNGMRGDYELTIPLLGEPQLENASAAVAALELLDINREHVISGLASVHWSGRMEVLRKEPLLIADAAHNGDSVRRLKEGLQHYFQFDHSILIMGTSADKDSPSMIKELAPFFHHVITATSEHPRATDAEELAEMFGRHGVQARTMGSVGQAVSEALSLAGKHDLICVTGSVFLVAEAIEAVRDISGERYPSTPDDGSGVRKDK